MLGISLNCLHQIRNEIIAPPQLDINLSPGIIAAIPQNDQAIVNGNAHNDKQPDNYQKNNNRTH